MTRLVSQPSKKGCSGGRITIGGIPQKTFNRLVKFIDDFKSLNFAGDVAMERLLDRVRPEPEAMPVARAGLEPVAGPTEDELFASALPTCSCARADSPLWQTGLPVLTLLPIPKAGKDTIAPEPNRRGRYRYDFDLAVVNNAAEALKDVPVLGTVLGGRWQPVSRPSPEP